MERITNNKYVAQNYIIGENGKIEPAPGSLTINFVGGFNDAGTTNEELLAIVINRLKNQQKAAPCKQTAIAITNIEAALLQLIDRENKIIETITN